MDKNLTYKGFLCRNIDKYSLFIRNKENKKKTYKVPIDVPKDFENTDSNVITIVCAKFFDGTDQIPLDNITYEFEDVYISIVKIGYLEFNVDNNKTVYDTITEDYKELVDVWDLVMKYFKTDNAKQGFEDYVKKDVWNK